MARGKNAAALFEVMSKAKVGKSAGTAGNVPVGPGLNRQGGGTGGTAKPEGGGGDAAKPRGTIPMPEFRAAGAAGGGANVGGEDGDERAVVVDSDKGEVSLRLSFVSVGIIVATIAVVVLVALLVGRRMGQRAVVGQETTEQLRSGPANPEVLRATGGQSGANGSVTDDPGSAGGKGAPVDPAVLGGTKPGDTRTVPGNAPAAAPGTKVSRTVGLNYLVCQSYDASEEEDAKAVIAVLASKGIGTTIERHVQGFGSRLVVVTADGYPPKAPEYEALRKKIDQISAEQARVNKKWRALTPMGYRWK